MEHDVIVTTSSTEPDFAELRSMLKGEPVEAKPEVVETPEPVTEPVKEASDAETVPETVETKTEPEEVEPELPEGVKKRIAKESEKQAKIQAEINRAVSARKAKEDELKQLSGSEPVQNTEKATSQGEPTAPDPNDFPTWGEYLTADRKFRSDWSTWLQSETRKTVESEFTAKQAMEESKRAWSDAAKAHSDLQEMADTVVASSPEPLQLAISALDNWADVTVHLGKNPVELEALVRAFQTNPYKGVADLGKLEARLTMDSKQTEPIKAVEKPLPTPLKPVAGSASASVPKVDLEKADDASFMKEIRRMTKVG